MSLLKDGFHVLVEVRIEFAEESCHADYLLVQLLEELLRKLLLREHVDLCLLRFSAASLIEATVVLCSQKIVIVLVSLSKAVTISTRRNWSSTHPLTDA